MGRQASNMLPTPDTGQARRLPPAMAARVRWLGRWQRRLLRHACHSCALATVSTRVAPWRNPCHPALFATLQGWVDEGDDGFEGEDDDDMHAHDEMVEEDEQELERAGARGMGQGI